MAKISGDDIKDKLQEIHDILGKKYSLEHPKDRRDWRTYEQQFSLRIGTAIKDLDPLIKETVSEIQIIHGPRHP